MELIEQLARAALERDHLKLRSLVQDLTRSKTDFSAIPRPSTTDSRLLVISAALAELLAQRNNGSTVFNVTALFKHKGHDGHKGKIYEIKALSPLCVLCVLRGETFSR